MALERAAADLVELGVAQEALDLVLLRVAVAAEHLHGIVGDTLGGRSGEELGRVGTEAIAALGRYTRGLAVKQAAGRLGLGVGLADVALDLTELGNRLAERVPLRRVAHHGVHAAVGDAERDR